MKAIEASIPSPHVVMRFLLESLCVCIWVSGKQARERERRDRTFQLSASCRNLDAVAINMMKDKAIIRLVRFVRKEKRGGAETMLTDGA